MEQRKLIRLGNSSYAIALPKDWIDKSGLKKGDDVFIERNANGEIVISPSFKKLNGEKKIEVDISKLNSDMLLKEMRAAYIKGYNSISFMGETTKRKKEEIKKNMLELPSFELIENKDNELLIKDFFNIEDSRIENFIKRIDNNLREMFEIIVIQLSNQQIDKAIVKDIEEIDRDINKMHFLISRIFFKGINNPSVLNALKTNPTKLVYEWWASFNLESIGDALKRISNILIQEKIDKPSLSKIFDAFKLITEGYELSLKSYLNNDKSIALKYLENSKNIREKIKEMLNEKKSHEIRLSNELNSIEHSCYQNIKMVSYLMF